MVREHRRRYKNLIKVKVFSPDGLKHWLLTTADAAQNNMNSKRTKSKPKSQIRIINQSCKLKSEIISVNYKSVINQSHKSKSQTVSHKSVKKRSHDSKSQLRDKSKSVIKVSTQSHNSMSQIKVTNQVTQPKWNTNIETEFTDRILAGKNFHTKVLKHNNITQKRWDFRWTINACL